MDLKLTVTIDTEDDEYHNLPRMIAEQVAQQMTYQPVFRDGLKNAEAEINKAKKKIIEELKAELTKNDLHAVTTLFKTQYGEAIKTEIKADLVRTLLLYLKADREFTLNIAMALIELSKREVKPE